MFDLKNEIAHSLENRDWDLAESLVIELGESLRDHTEARNIFRDEILPICSADVVKDFWRHVMDDASYTALIEHMTMVSIHCLDLRGFSLGKNYSFGVDDDGLRQLYLDPDALAALKDYFAPGRFSTLRIIIANVSTRNSSRV